MEISFSHPYITEIIHKKLNVGDYGCIFEDGYEPPIYFEKKSLTDLWGTLGKQYSRFKKEILRAKEAKVLLIIIIEGTLTKVLKGIERSQRSGDEVCQQLFTLLIRHRVPFVCCSTREEMARWIEEFYLAVGREHLLNKKEQCQPISKPIKAEIS